MAKNVVVIGSGVGGLASAALLAKDGYSVTVIEKNEQPGGRASLLERDGFCFDMGPSWYLMPDVYERFFQAMGTSTAEQLTLRKLSPHYRIFFADGETVDITGDMAQDKALFERIEPGSSARFDQYLEESKRKYEISLRSILYRNMNSFRDFADKDLMRDGRELHVFESMQRYVSRFFKTEKMQQIIQYTLVFLGGAPKNTPALYSLLSHIDFNLGVWCPDGGMYAIPRALVRLGEQYGVRYVYNSPVERIDVKGTGKDRRVRAVHAGKTTYLADYVVSNADYQHTEALLSDPSARQFSDRYWRRRTLAPSAFILYLGVRGKMPELVHHNLLFARDWNKHFNEIYFKKIFPTEPSIYICNPNKSDPNLAPADHENLFVLVPIGTRLEETPQSREQYADHVIDLMEKMYGIRMRDRIVVKEMFSISDFARRYNSIGGTALGLAHTTFQSSVFRPPNRSRRVPNLYFVGGNTTPGIGVPMCLISAHLIQDRFRKENG
jgi:phytoene desaturase